MGKKIQFYFNVIALKLQNKITPQLGNQKTLSSELYGETERISPAFL
jgi:hypothetical protein